MSALDCSIEGCEDPGVIPSTDEDGTETWRCFAHAGIVAGDAPQVAQEAPGTIDADIANNFAAELLEAASVAMTGDADVINGVLEQLAGETMLDRAIVAGIQLAISMLIAAGAVPAEDVLSLSQTLRDNAADAEWMDQDPPPPASEVSPVLAGLGSDESPAAGTDDDPEHEADWDECPIHGDMVNYAEGPCPACAVEEMNRPDDPDDPPINDNDESEHDND